MSTEINQTAASVFSAVLDSDGFRCPRAQLERSLGEVPLVTFDEAIAVLLADGALISDGEELQVPLEGDRRPPVEGLAAAVNAILVIGETPALTFEQVCAEAERDPSSPEEQREVLLSLTLLRHCGLASHDEDGRWRPTRAALWAERLSF